ncbi:hypothetical protein B0H14DRAFT_3745852 [Mycena olivaceomarginata]|nr:hypothetical protein B0H14DRAFT_3745852 [Mycena olivaceomarginata]
MGTAKRLMSYSDHMSWCGAGAEVRRDSSAVALSAAAPSPVAPTCAHAAAMPTRATRVPCARPCAVEAEELWIGCFACADSCDRLFACGVHRCTQPCHPASVAPTPCPHSPKNVRTCPCGRRVIAIASASAPQDAAGNAFPPRADCTARCGGILPCGHAYAAAWHEGGCPPCTECVVPAQILCLVTFTLSVVLVALKGFRGPAYTYIVRFIILFSRRFMEWPELNEHDQAKEHQHQVLRIAKWTFVLSYGRAMFTFGSLPTNAGITSQHKQLVLNFVNSITSCAGGPDALLHHRTHAVHTDQEREADHRLNFRARSSLAEGELGEAFPYMIHSWVSVKHAEAFLLAEEWPRCCRLRALAPCWCSCCHTRGARGDTLPQPKPKPKMETQHKTKTESSPRQMRCGVTQVSGVIPLRGVIKFELNLGRAHADFRLVDVSAKLPALRGRPGLTAWRPTDKSLCTTYDTYETFMVTCTQGEMVKAKMTRGHWPPEDVEALELPRCLRIYPHLQGTGGFFVAVLERTSTGTTEVEVPREKKRGADEPAEMPESKKPRLDSGGVVSHVKNAAEPPTETESVSEAATKNPAPPKAEKQKKGEGGGSFKENPYTFLPPDDVSVVSCVNFNSARASTSRPPSPPQTSLCAPPPDPDASTNGHRNLYITNDLIKLLVMHNDYNCIRLTCAGIKALPLVIPYMDPATIVEGDMGVLTMLVEKVYPLIGAFTEGAFRTALIGARDGQSHCVLPVCAGRDVGFLPLLCTLPLIKILRSLSHNLLLLWKLPSSLTLMINKKAKSALSMHVFGKDITSPVKEKPVVVSADTVEGDDLDAGDAAVKTEEDVEEDGMVHTFDLLADSFVGWWFCLEGSEHSKERIGSRT